MTDTLQRLTDEGVAIWLDDVSRDRITSGELDDLVHHRHVVGATTSSAVLRQGVKSAGYRRQLAELSNRDVTADEALHILAATDAREAADILRPVFDATHGHDGRVSIEVDPCSARHTSTIVAEAGELAWLVGRPNLFITAPATEAGLPAITQLLAMGISVHATLIFSPERYRAVMDAHMAGLERAAAARIDLSGIESVASFSAPEVDGEIDRRLERSAGPAGRTLKGRAGIAAARLFYHLHEEVLATPRWRALEALGANAQRPLWSSAAAHDPAASDTRYITELVAAGTVSTMPRDTLEAAADHALVVGDSINGTYPQAQDDLDRLADVGVSYADVARRLEDENIGAHEHTWRWLLGFTRNALSRRAGHDTNFDKLSVGRHDQLSG